MEITMTIKIEDDQLRKLLGLQEEVKKDEPVDAGLYCAFFDETCAGWQKDAASNKFFLLRQQDYLNEKLKMRGYLFLNEAYEALGIPRTKAGQVVGWLYDPESSNRDSYVDLGLFKDCNREFVNGYKNTVLIDPNVDGDILDTMEGA
jgi:hypothetical protein